MSANNGGPAFLVLNDGCQSPRAEGMSLRDYFAAKVLPSVYADAMKEASEGSGLFSIPDWRVGLAMDAYRYADAMLKAREATE